MAKKKTQFTLDSAKAVEWLRGTDGYAVLLPAFFEGILPEKDIKRLTRNHAGGEGKYAVTKGGEVLDSCVGVAEFSAVDALADLVGVEPCHSFMGRGKNFRETVGRILRALEPKQS